MGSWELVTYVVLSPDGAVLDVPFGDRPRGVLTYTDAGRVHVHVMQPERRRCGTERLVACAPETKVAAFDTHFSYVGRYVRDGDLVHHRVEIGSFPDWSGATLERTVHLDGDLLTLIGPTAPRIPVLTWRREADR